MNEFVNETEPLEIPILEIDESVERDQVASLRAVREGRDHEAVRARLEALKLEARGTGNLVPRLLECASVHTSLGEISAALTEVFGEYREQPFF